MPGLEFEIRCYIIFKSLLNFIFVKNIWPVVFLLLTINSFGQKGFKINILSSLDYSFLGDFNREYAFDPSIDYKVPLGGSLDISFEIESGQSSSFQTGIRYSKKNYYPDFEITLYYGGQLTFEGNSIWVQLPKLMKLQYQTISIPITHKYYFKKGNQCSFYILVGAVAGFRISKEESFEDFFYNTDVDYEINKISARDQQIQLFNTAIEIGGGMNLKIRKDLALIFQFHAHLFDFRKAEDQLMEIWPQVFEDNKVWWKDSFLPLGQASLGLGIQKSF
jgi:hypothetical protein